jgi:putative peptidoglycan lipid II flippase
MSIVRDCLNATTASLLGKLLGFAIPFYIANVYGITSDTDAFFFSYGFVLLVALVVAPVLENMLVPFIAEMRDNSAQLNAFVWTLLFLSGIGALCGALVSAGVMQPYMRHFTTFNDEHRALAMSFFVEVSPLLFFVIISSVIVALLNSNKDFFVAAGSPAIRSIVVIVSIAVLHKEHSLAAVAYGYVVGEMLRFMFLFLYSVRRGYLSLHVDINFNLHVKRFVIVAMPQMIGTLLVSFAPMISKTIATWTGVGGLTVYEYADRLYLVLVTVLYAGIYPVLLSHWSDLLLVENRRSEEFRRDVRAAAVTIGILSVAAALCSIALGPQVVSILYGAADLGADSQKQISDVFRVLCVGFVFYGVGTVFTRALMAMKNTVTLMMLSGLNVMYIGGIGYVLVGEYGLRGIAMGNVAAVILTTAALWFVFERICSRMEEA